VTEDEPNERLREIIPKLTRSTTNGLYHPELDLIVLKGTGSEADVASVLAHEIAHQVKLGEFAQK
jgi:hypothetical protein